MSWEFNRENAVSDALGAVLLVAVVAMAVTLLGVALLSQPTQEKIPALNAEITTIGRDIVISHNGGDSLRKSDMLIVVNGSDLKDSFSRSGSPWSSWSVGDYLNYTVPDTAGMPLGVSIYYRGSKSSYLIQSMGVPTSITGDGSQPASTAPVAAFTSDKQTGASPLKVQFTDMSTGTTPLTYAWDFNNDGTTDSTASNPEYTYASAGTYTVKLTVTNGAGSDDEIKAGYIVVKDGPVAAFTSDKTSGMAPLSVQFTDQSTGTAPLTYAWDFNNDGMSDSSVKNPLYSYPNPGKYTVALTVTNAIGSNKTVKTNYITVTPNPPWYNCGWSNRKNITIDKAKVSGTLSDFPVLINLASDNDLRTGARSDGNDILFTSADGTTKLSHEIETYTSSTGALVAWVKVPTVQSSQNTTIYMYFNNSGSANQQNPTSVWDSGFKAVWHLKENPSGAAPQMKDSTSNAYDGSSGGTMTASDQVPAKINGGLDFDGTDDYLSTNYYQTGVTAYTIETWVKTSTITPLSVIVHDRGYDELDPGGTGKSLTLSIGGTYRGGPTSTGNVAFGVDSNSIYGGVSSTTKTVNDNTWHHVVGVWSAPSGTTVVPSQFSMYIDGDLVSTTPVVTSPTTTSPLTGLPGYGTRIAQHLPWGTYLQGMLDEIRISTSSRSSDWIKTEYNNQNSPPTFHYLGNLEQWTC